MKSGPALPIGHGPKLVIKLNYRGLAVGGRVDIQAINKAIAGREGKEAPRCETLCVVIAGHRTRGQIGIVDRDGVEWHGARISAAARVQDEHVGYSRSDYRQIRRE